MTDCTHPRKYVSPDSDWNMDMQIYYRCPDCGAGWRQEPENEADAEIADDALLRDAAAMGL